MINHLSPFSFEFLVTKQKDVSFWKNYVDILEVYETFDVAERLQKSVNPTFEIFENQIRYLL